MRRYNIQIEDAFFHLDRLWEEGNWTEGLEVLENILLEEPDNGKAHAWMGWFAYVKLKDFKLAQLHYDYALKFDPNYPGIYLNYINVLMALKNYNKVVEIAHLGLEAPAVDKDDLYNEMGRAYDALADYKAAAEAFKSAIRSTMDEEAGKTYRNNIKIVRRKAGRLATLIW